MKKLAIIGALAALVATTAVAFVPNDPNLSLQPSLNLLRMQQAWDYEKGCPEIPQPPTCTKIAFVGTGFAYPAPPISDININGIANFSSAPNTSDDIGSFGVTTTSTGVAGADVNNGTLVAGVFDSPAMYVAKVMNGLGNQALDAWVAAGVDWAVAQGAKIIQLDVRPSNADGQYPLTVASLNTAIAAKRIVVIPVFGCTMCAKTYLELNVDPKAIFVASTSVAGTPVTTDATWDVIDLSAPGAAVYAHVAGGCCLERTASNIPAAHVTGVMALLRERGISEWNIHRIIPLLRSPSTWDNERGWGVLDATCLMGLAGDMNDTRNADTEDTIAVLNHFGDVGDSKYNVDGAGVVDLSDALIVIALFGAGCT